MSETDSEMDPSTVLNLDEILKAAGGRPWHDLRHSSGKFAAVTDMAVEVEGAHLALPSLIDAFSARMDLLRRLYEQNIAVEHEHKSEVDLVPLPDIEMQMRSAIAESYARAFSLGKRAAADLTSANEDQKRSLAALAQDEYGYLSQFCGAMRSREGRMSYSERMEWYALAAREAFWMGWALARPSSAHRMISWHFGDVAVHCADCQRFAAHGPYSQSDFQREVIGKGFLPQSGRLACRGRHCRCWLSDNSSIEPHGQGSSGPEWIGAVSP